VWVDEVDLGRHMVEEGQAWSLRTRFDQGPLVKQERMAHALGRGLHGASVVVMPRDYRRIHGPCPSPAGPGAPKR
jgi:endonuclease YncB( thermonuclease family)